MTQLRVKAGSSFCSPEGIRTLVAGLRSQSPRPLDDGALVSSKMIACGFHFLTFSKLIAFGFQLLVHIQNFRSRSLGYQDSNLDLLNQNQQGCQLPHTPLRLSPKCADRRWSTRAKNTLGITALLTREIPYFYGFASRSVKSTTGICSSFARSRVASSIRFC